MQGDRGNGSSKHGFGRLLVNRLEPTGSYDYDRHGSPVDNVDHDLLCCGWCRLPSGSSTRERCSDDILEHGQQLDEQHHEH
jgi:hypothetical protein